MQRILITVPKYRDKLSVSFWRLKKSSWTSWNLQMGPIGFLETSVWNYRSTLRDVPQERRRHLQRSGSPKSRFGYEICDTLRHIHHLHWQFPELRLCLFNDAGWGLRECCLAAKCWWDCSTWPIECLLRPDHFRRPVFLWLIRIRL